MQTRAHLGLDGHTNALTKTWAIFTVFQPEEDIFLLLSHIQECFFNNAPVGKLSQFSRRMGQSELNSCQLLKEFY